MIVCLSATIVSSSAHFLFLREFHPLMQTVREKQGFQTRQKGPQESESEYISLCIPRGFRLPNQKVLPWRFTSAQTAQVWQVQIDLPSNKKFVEWIGAKGTCLPLLCQKHKPILYVTFHLTNFVSKWTHHEEMFVEVQWTSLTKWLWGDSWTALCCIGRREWKDTSQRV